MARFELSPPFTEKDLGRAVLNIAEAAGKNSGDPAEADKATFKADIATLLAERDRASLELVYDTPTKIHLVIPYLPKGGYAGNSLAEEAMGGISIMGCGR